MPAHGPGQPARQRLRDPATPLTTEKEARGRELKPRPRAWKIVNPDRCNEVGEPVGYRLLPGDNVQLLRSARRRWRRRAGFVNHHVWVTPFRADEQYAAGDYPNQHAGGDGLPRWTDADRTVEDTDVVLWYTFGHTHIPRPEDYPVMPDGLHRLSAQARGVLRPQPRS